MAEPEDKKDEPIFIIGSPPELVSIPGGKYLQCDQCKASLYLSPGTLKPYEESPPDRRTLLCIVCAIKHPKFLEAELSIAVEQKKEVQEAGIDESIIEEKRKQFDAQLKRAARAYRNTLN